METQMTPRIAMAVLLTWSAAAGQTIPIAQQAYLKASNAGTNAQFGFSAAVSGDTIVVGAPGEASNATGVNGNQADKSVHNAGAGYVFVRSGTNWSQQAYLKASNTGQATDPSTFGNQFGFSVAISGDTVVVGAPYESSSSIWVNGNQNNSRGVQSGAAYVFVREGTIWRQQAYLKASDPDITDMFGCSVAVSDDIAVVGANQESSMTTGVNGNLRGDGSTYSGAAYVFVRNGTNWSQQASLKASNARPLAQFGSSVAVSGEVVVVGAFGDRCDATGVNGNQSTYKSRNSGAAYVFTRSWTNWSQQAYLKASNTSADAFFGCAVAVSSNTVVVGAIGESSTGVGVNGKQTDNGARGSGAAYVFTRSGSTWSQQAYLKASNPDKFDEFGSSVAVFGDRVVVGAHDEASNATGVNGNQSDNSASWSGAAYVFVRSGTNWKQQAYLKASNTGKADRFGHRVALSGDTVVVAANQESSTTTKTEGIQGNGRMRNAGAAYVFTGFGSAPQGRPPTER